MLQTAMPGGPRLFTERPQRFPLMRGLLPVSKGPRSLSSAMGWGSPISPSSSLAALDLLKRSWEMGP